MFYQQHRKENDQHSQKRISSNVTSAPANPVQSSTPDATEWQDFVGDEVATLNPVQHPGPDAAVLLSPAHFHQADDLQFIGPIQHSTPDVTENLGTSYLNVIGELPVILTDSYQNEVVVVHDDSEVYIGPQSEDADGDLASTLLWTEDHSEENSAASPKGIVSITHCYTLPLQKKTCILFR